MANLIPAETQILNEIEKRLWNIDIAYGYQTKVQKIERSRLKPFENGDLPAISFWIVDEPESITEYGIETNTLNIVIGYFDKTRDEPLSDMATKLKTDINIAVNRATSAPKYTDEMSVNLGDLIDSFVRLTSEYITGGTDKNPIGGVLCEYQAIYKVSIEDPYTIITE